MAKKYIKKGKSAPKKQKRQKAQKKAKKVKKKEATPTPKSRIEKKEELHKFIIRSGLEFDDILSKVIPLKGGKYGVLSESGEFLIFSINQQELKSELSFQFFGANLFCQLGNGKFVFNSFNYISIWELKSTKMIKLREYQTLFGLVTYSMEPINDNYCAISGPSDIIELIQYTNSKKISVIYLDYQNSKSKEKKKSKKNEMELLSPPGIGCLYYQKKHNRLLATHFSNILRVWNCDFSKNKYELFKEVEFVTNFSGKIIHEMKNKILVGGRGVITILNNDIYEIIDYVDLGNIGYEIFSMEIVKYYNFKEFVFCGLRNGRILGVDITNKKIEFNKKKINDTGKDNEMNVKDGKLTFYGENVSYITKIENKNMILVASHDHTLKLIEY
jgi:hypothetical protein